MLSRVHGASRVTIRTGATRGKQTSRHGEPSLRELRRALFAPRYRALKTFLLAASLAATVTGAIRLSRATVSAGVYDDAALATSALEDAAAARLRSAAGGIESAATALAQGFGGVAPKLAASAPARGPAGNNGQSQSGGIASSSALDRFTDWIFTRFPDELSDKCAEAYYGLLSLFSDALDPSSYPDLNARLEDWENWIVARFELGLGNAGEGFDLRNPSEMLSDLFRASSAINVAGTVLFLILVLTVALPASQALSNVRRKMRPRRWRHAF